MKTLRHIEAGNLKRRPDEEAHKMFETGKWEYVPKSVWKEQVRDTDLDVDVIVDEETGQKSVSLKKSNKMSKATKRHLKKNNK